MKTTKATLILLTLIFASFFTSCDGYKLKEKETQKKETEFTISENSEMGNDKRMSLKLNTMQKNHQLVNMRDHLEAVQSIIALLSSDKYDEASKVAYSKLGSTTEMKLMCASFGDKNFEYLGLEFHKSADKMSEIFKNRNKEKSLKALSNTMNYCVQCHATYRQ
ncbi:MAG: cytochrome C [Chlorobi bacterium]|nr:cytochrome C [Chlorobiota bacterium]